MFHLYTKVLLIITIAYAFGDSLFQQYLSSVETKFSFTFLLLIVFLYVWLKIKKNHPTVTKVFGYILIFSVFAFLVGLRFKMNHEKNPLHYWKKVSIPTGKNQKLFFVAKVKSMDGFKKERYRITLELINSYTNQKNMRSIFRYVEKLSAQFSNTSSPTNNSRIIDYLSSSLYQNLNKFSFPINVFSDSYLKMKGLNSGDLILIQPYYIRKTEEINEASSYRSYLIANGIYANWYYNPRNLIIIKNNHPPFIFKVWTKIKNTIDQYIAHPSSSLAYAMFTGNKQEMPNYIKEYFRVTGTYHVLAVSGMHAGLLSIFFFYIFRILGFRKKTSLGLIFLTILPAYLFITDFQISIQRTYLMGLVGFLLIYFDRGVNLMAILCLSFIVVSIYNPSVVYSISFQLSYGAVFGIAQAIRILKLYKTKNKFINGLWVSVGAQLGTLPMVIYYFGYNNFFSLIYNIVVSFLVSAYYLYTLLFLLFGIPLSYLDINMLSDFMVGSIGTFLTQLGNILFLFLHYVSYIKFEWFYFSYLQNQLNYAIALGLILFVLSEWWYWWRSKYLKKQAKKINQPRMLEDNSIKS